MVADLFHFAWLISPDRGRHSYRDKTTIVSRQRDNRIATIVLRQSYRDNHLATRRQSSRDNRIYDNHIATITSRQDDNRLATWRQSSRDNASRRLSPLRDTNVVLSHYECRICPVVAPINHIVHFSSTRWRWFERVFANVLRTYYLTKISCESLTLEKKTLGQNT